MDTWRYLPLSVNNAAMNMAIDEAILQARVEDKVPNTLRLYRWQPSAVSIGRNQNPQEASLPRNSSKTWRRRCTQAKRRRNRLPRFRRRSHLCRHRQNR